MNKTNNHSYKLHPQKIVQMGYDALVKKLGIVGAAQFLMSVSPGQGDSVKFYRQLRENKNVDETVKKIKQSLS